MNDLSAKQQKYFRDLKTLFLDFFKHLFTNNEIYASNSELGTTCLTLHSKLKATGDGTWCINFDPPWAIDIIKNKYFGGQKVAYLLVGGIVNVENYSFKNYGFYVTIIRNSYSKSKRKRCLTSCCEKHFRKESRIVRRYHFDVAHANLKTYETISHFQFGGIHNKDQIAVLKKEGVPLHYCLDNQLDIPRFPYPPIGFIMLLDMLLRQFQTSIDTSFIESNNWLNLVSKSENFRISSYYEKISQYLKNKPRDIKNSEIKTLFGYLCSDKCVF